MTYSGKIMVSVGNKPDTEFELLERKKIICQVEQYINDKIALNIFKKFGVLVRVHL